MSKKDFELIAKTLKDSKQHLQGVNPLINQAFESQWKFMVNRISYELMTTNPRFNREKFLQACGYND